MTETQAAELLVAVQGIQNLSYALMAVQSITFGFWCFHVISQRVSVSNRDAIGGGIG